MAAFGRNTFVVAAPAAPGGPGQTLKRNHFGPLRRWRQQHPRLSFWLAFLAITAVGTFLRFFRLSHQAIWGDEAITVLRVGGTYQHTLGSLQGQGFPPGWYVLLWAWKTFLEWLGVSPATALSPGVLRVVPAFFGAAAVPAMYLLARQFSTRKYALFAMLLAAINPFLIYYSRDLKMYSPYYCLVILQAALCIRWFSGGRRGWAWFTVFFFVTVAMALVDTITWFMVAIEVIWLLSVRRVRGFTAVGFAAAVAGAAVLPLWWYTHKTQWMVGVVKDKWNGGIGWVGDTTHLHWPSVAGLPCDQLLGYLWPRFPLQPWVRNWFALPSHAILHLGAYYSGGMAVLEFDVAALLLACLLIGLLPWRRWRGRGAGHPVGRRRVAPRWWVAVWVILPLVAFYLASLPKHDALSIFPHMIVWEPRYLGLVVPALILWLAAALGRLPGRMFRTVACAVLLVATTASALSNAFTYRQMPWNVVAKTVLPYFKKGTPSATQMFATQMRFPQNAQQMDMLFAEHVAPTHRALYYQAYRYLPQMHYLGYNFVRWHNMLHAVAGWNAIDTIVTLDDCWSWQNDPLNHAYVQKILGPNWRCVRTKKFRLYLRWRFFVFRRWRLRIWQRVGRVVAKTPQSRTAVAHTHGPPVLPQIVPLLR